MDGRGGSGGERTQQLRQTTITEGGSQGLPSKNRPPKSSIVTALSFPSKQEFQMNRFYRAVKLTLLIVALSTWFLARIARAQTQTPTKTTSPEPKDLDLDEGWHVSFTPYI